jgi:hypothetical protein
MAHLDPNQYRRAAFSKVERTMIQKQKVTTAGPVAILGIRPVVLPNTAAATNAGRGVTKVRDATTSFKHPAAALGCAAGVAAIALR